MRNGTFIFAIVAIAGIVFGDEPRPFDHDLEDAEVGKLPLGWISDKTGNGQKGIWRVLEDESAPRGPKVLAQVSPSPKYLFNLCLIDNSIFLNGEISVAFKALGGENDQGGGIVWRYVDSNNYYLARVNPLESNFRLYKVVAGRRIQIATKEGVNCAANEWHTLTIHHLDTEIVCLLDGEKHLEATDTMYKKPGKVGLWTKSDAQTFFDGLTSSPN